MAGESAGMEECESSNCVQSRGADGIRTLAANMGKQQQLGLGDLQFPPGMLEIVEVAHYEDLFAFRPRPIPTQDKVEPADPQLQRWTP